MKSIQTCRTIIIQPINARQQRHNDHKNVTNQLCKLVLWMLLCQNLYSNLMNYGMVSSKIVTLEDDHFSKPVVSLCQFVVDAFRDCRLLNQNFTCPFVDTFKCNHWLMSNLDNVGAIFDKLANCSFHQRMRVESWIQNYETKTNHLKSPYSTFRPVFRYLNNGMYCLLFTGYSEKNSIYSISVQETKALNKTARLALFWMTFQAIDLNRLRFLEKVQTSIIRQSLGQNWTLSINEFGPISVFVHSKDQLPATSFANQGLLRPGNWQFMINIRRVRIHRLANSLENNCRHYDDNEFHNQKHCQQRCSSVQANFGSSSDLYTNLDRAYKISSHPPTTQLLSKCFSKCLPKCKEDQFHLRDLAPYRTARNQIFIRLDEQTDMIECKPLLTFISLMLYSLNQLSIAFGWNFLLAIDRLAQICSTLCLRLSARWQIQNFLHKLALIATFLLLSHQTLQLVNLYLSCPTTTTTEINMQTMQKQYRLTLCFYLEDVHFFGQDRLAYDIWFFSLSLRVLFKEWNQANQWLQNKKQNRKTVATFLSKEQHFKNHLNYLYINLKRIDQNQSISKLKSGGHFIKKYLSLPQLRSFPFSRLKYETLQFNEILLQYYGIYEGIILGADCLQFSHLDEIITGYYKCFRVVISQKLCLDRFISKISTIFLMPLAHLYLDEGVFESQSSKLDNLNAIVEERLEIATGNCQDYSKLKLANNISCSSRAECINVCMIEHSVREFQALPADLPFIFPKYVSLLGPWLFHQIRFDTRIKHEMFQSQCQQVFTQPDCQRSRFFNEFRDYQQVFKSSSINFITSQTKVTLWSSYKFSQFLMDLMGIFSICVGMSLLNLTKTLMHLLRFLFELPPQNFSFLRLFLLIGLAYQQWQLFLLYQSKPVSTLIKSGASIGSVNIVPTFVLCFSITHILKSPSKMDSNVNATLASLRFVHYSNYHFQNVSQILDATFNFSQLVRRAEFLISNKKSVRFQLFCKKALSNLESSKKYQSLRMNTMFMGDKKCFVFKNFIDSSSSDQTLLANIRFKSKHRLKPNLQFYTTNLGLPMFGAVIDQPMHVIYSYQLIASQSTIQTCQNEINNLDLFRSSSQVQKKTLLKYGSVHTLIPLDDQFFQHPIDNRNLDTIRTDVSRFLKENHKILNNSKCVINYKFRLMNEIVASKSARIKISFLSESSSILTTRLQLSWNEIIVYCAFLVSFWLDFTAQQILQTLLIRLMSFKHIVCKIVNSFVG